MFFKKPIFAEIAVLAVAIAFLHMAATYLRLYWTTEWFDILMHFLGGLFIGLCILFICFISGYLSLPKENLFLVHGLTIGFVLIVGLVWELWEIFVGLTDVFTDQGDTILDVVMDTLGALAAIWYIRQRLWKGN